jgi:hypothetical protein
LQIAECLRPDLRYLRWVEIERCHATKQKIGCLGTTLRNGTEFCRSHADISGDALNFHFATA